MWHGAGGKLARGVRVGVSIRNGSTRKGATDRILELVSTMPRERQRNQAQAHAQIAENSSKLSASTAYAQVLGAGNPNSLYIFTDQKRYLFNCGEGVQRLAHEHRVKLSRLEHVFITSKTWQHLGGLPGVSLTLQDVGVPQITLHGPPGLDELYNATRRFVIMKDMEVTMAPCSPSHDFEDNVMTVKYVLIGPEDKIFDPTKMDTASDKRSKIAQQDLKLMSEFEDDDIDYYNHEGKASSRRSQSRSPSPTARRSPDRKAETNRTLRRINNMEKKSNCSVSYICTMKKRLGTLDLNKCVERGVKPGPLLGLLKQGKDVVLDDGRLVLSADVKTPDQLGPVFIVLDVPDLTHFKESDFKEHFEGHNPPENVPTLVVHFTPKHVVDTDRYQAFARKFGADAKHLLLNSEGCSGSVAVHRVQHKLHLLDADIFPLLNDATVPVMTWVHPDNSSQSDMLKNKIALAQFESIIKSSKRTESKPAAVSMEVCSEGEASGAPAAWPLELHEAGTLTVFHLRPKKELDRSAELKLNIQEYILETMDVEGFPASLEHFRRLADARHMERSLAARARPYPRVLFLGTGSCIPNKTRNTSAILLHIDEKHSILLDCGEGTYGQLVRFFGPKQVKNVLASLRAIYVSHLHADHHIGLIGVLQGRRRALNDLAKQNKLESQADSSLYLLAPGQIMTWLSIYDQQFEKIRAEFQIVPNQLLLPNAVAGASGSVTPAMLSSMGLWSVKTCQVQHCPNSFGVCLEALSGERITYSGDTMPCDELVALGEDSTLLIHEATMEDELAAEARAKKHSTTSQAIDVARRMRAKYTILTHFSQRYARLPRLGEQILSNNSTVGIAFDNMQVTMDDLEILPHMYGPLRLMFAEHCTELEQRAAKRAHKRVLNGSRSPSPSAKTKVEGPTSQGQAAKSQRSSNTTKEDKAEKNENKPPKLNKQKWIAAKELLSNIPRISRKPTSMCRDSPRTVSPIKVKPIQTYRLENDSSCYGKALVTPHKQLSIGRFNVYGSNTVKPKAEQASPYSTQSRNYLSRNRYSISQSSSPARLAGSKCAGAGCNASRANIETRRNINRTQSDVRRPTSRPSSPPAKSVIAPKSSTASRPTSNVSPANYKEAHSYKSTALKTQAMTNNVNSKSNTKYLNNVQSVQIGKNPVHENKFERSHRPLNRTPNRMNSKSPSQEKSDKIYETRKELYKSAKCTEAARETHNKVADSKAKHPIIRESESVCPSDELKKAIMKYRSKQYIMDSKYERIEGLNWISWS